MQRLDEKVKSLMDVSENLIHSGNQTQRAKICKVCGKEGQSMAIRDHIEGHLCLSKRIQVEMYKEALMHSQINLEFI